MSLTILMTISLLFVSALCELFTTGVQLHVPKESSKVVLAECNLLTRLASELWQTGGFQNCIPSHRSGTFVLSNILQYRVTVDIDKMPNFPEMRTYYEKLAFVNQALNSGMNVCTTTTGNNWQLWERNRGETYKFRMFIYLNGTSVKVPICDRFAVNASNQYQHCVVRSCLATLLRTTNTGEFSTVEIEVESYDYAILSSERIYRTARGLTSKINQAVRECVVVNKVETRESGRERAIYVQFTSDNITTESCDLLLKIRPNAFREGGFHACHNAKMDPEEMFAELHLVCLKLREQNRGEFLAWMSDEEVALRVETMFNSDDVGCIAHEPGYIAGVVQKTDERLSFYVSGPFSKNMCKQIKQYLDVPFSAHYLSCNLEQTGSSNLSGNIMSLYRLKFKYPFYAIDQYVYLEYQSTLIKDMNRPHTTCLYNGYSQLEKAHFP